MSSHPAPPQPLVAQHQVELMVVPEVAWRMISDANLLAAWYAFGGAAVEPTAGGTFELSWEPGKVFSGRVIAATAPTTLTYRLPQEPGVALTDTNATEVRFDVAASPDHTDRSILSVAETGFENLDPRYTPFETFKAAHLAWIGALGLLVQATGIPPQDRAGSGD